MGREYWASDGKENISSKYASLHDASTIRKKSCAFAVDMVDAVVEELLGRTPASAMLNFYKVLVISRMEKVALDLSCTGSVQLGQNETLIFHCTKLERRTRKRKH